MKVTEGRIKEIEGGKQKWEKGEGGGVEDRNHKIKERCRDEVKSTGMEEKNEDTKNKGITERENRTRQQNGEWYTNELSSFEE